jgi:hypothetical protein
MDTVKKTLILARWLALLLFVGVGAGLVLLRPSVATWGFYLYCLGLNGAANVSSLFLFGPPWDLVVSAIYFAFASAGFVGVAVFAACFLHEPPVGWRAGIYRFAPLAFLIVFGLQMYWVLAGLYFGWPARDADATALTLEAVLVVAAVYALTETYLRAKGTDRQRIRWVIVGFGIALVAFLTDQILTREGFNPPYWLHGSLALTSVVVPLTVAYAVIKHRVIDVSFVVSRALVYGILTTLLVGLFSLIDWFFTDYLRLARLGTFAEVGAVVAFGFWFNGLHRRVDTIIDATFFRQRHRAEVQLARNAVALPFATTTKSVGQALVEEPVRTLSLASAALFRRNTIGGYVREESAGWAASDLSHLDESDDHFLMLLQAEGGPLSLFDHPWRSDRVPGGPALPILALPIIVRRELAAIVFYGSHVHGEAFDPDEIKAIAGLATGAAAAYDHLEAEEMRRSNDLLQRKVETMQALLAEAQIQPT